MSSRGIHAGQRRVRKFSLVHPRATGEGGLCNQAPAFYVARAAFMRPGQVFRGDPRHGPPTSHIHHLCPECGWLRELPPRCLAEVEEQATRATSLAVLGNRWRSLCHRFSSHLPTSRAARCHPNSIAAGPRPHVRAAVLEQKHRHDLLRGKRNL